MTRKKRLNLDVREREGEGGEAKAWKKKNNWRKRIQELNTYSSVATSMMPVWSGGDGDLRLLGINIPTKYGSSRRRASLPVNRKRLLYSITP